MRVCLEPGCPALTSTTRCHDHERARDKARGTRAERGYDAAYDRERRRLVAAEKRGARYSCWNCGTPTPPGQWQLGHDKRDRTVLRGPECLACNLNTSAV